MAKSSLSNREKDRIYELNKVDGFSQNKLADLYDVSQGTISNAIKDKRHEKEKMELKQIIQNGVARGAQAVFSEEKNQEVYEIIEEDIKSIGTIQKKDMF